MSNTPKLFTPLQIGPVTAPNRIAVAPMCQYSADDGAMSDWHMQHLMSLAMSGAGLVMIEATGVERRGRITHGCVGLYTDGNERGMARVLAAARAVQLPGTLFGIQLQHAGRKASAQLPWHGGGALKPDQDPWQTVSASAKAFGANWHTPEALDDAGIARTIAAFVQAAKRAARLGIDIIELHMTHGYLVHQFFSPLSNMRTDDYGGSLDNRMRFGLDLMEAVRAAVPNSVAVGVRMAASDWLDGGITIDDAVTFTAKLKERGAAYACVSSGGNDPGAKIAVGPNYQVGFANEIKQKTGIVTRAVGMIVAPEQAEDILQKNHADQIALGRAFLDNPRWGWHAADALGVDLKRPPQYERAGKSLWAGASLKHTR
jgi:2,4-dienoyl-CoA reductase-like NADH-dependent reductase (Old Yellow Enzyme family)